MIFINELIKAFCKRTTIAIFAVLLLLNGVLLYINETKQTLEYTPEQYKAAYQTLEGLDTHVAFERISQKKSELELIQRLSFGEDISQENCNAEELLKSYKTKSYLEFTDDIYSEIELTDRLFEEISACENYDSYLENIDSTARKMTGISLTLTVSATKISHERLRTSPTSKALSSPPHPQRAFQWQQVSSPPTLSQC